jgi:hypothetical protein
MLDVAAVVNFLALAHLAHNDLETTLPTLHPNVVIA